MAARTVTRGFGDKNLVVGVVTVNCLASGSPWNIARLGGGSPTPAAEFAGPELALD